MPITEVIQNPAPKNDPTKHTAAFKIFNYRFIVQIAQMHLISQEELDNCWRVTSGNAAVDRTLAREIVQAQLTIAEMAKYHANGVSMTLATPEDSVRIYGIIHEHLQDWKRELQSSVTLTTAPVDELRELDELAAIVYNVARYYWNNQPYHGKLNTFLQRINNSVGGRVGRTRTVAAPAAAAEPVPLTTHTPMADALAKLSNSRRRSWS